MAGTLKVLVQEALLSEEAPRPPPVSSFSLRMALQFRGSEISATRTRGRRTRHEQRAERAVPNGFGRPLSDGPARRLGLPQRPHAYQALAATAVSRQVVGISGVCGAGRGCPETWMTGFGGVSRHLVDRFRRAARLSGCPQIQPLPAPHHFLNLFPLPQGQGSLRPTGAEVGFELWGFSSASRMAS
jgi:hypothetical protein